MHLYSTGSMITGSWSMIAGSMITGSKRDLHAEIQKAMKRL